MSTRTQAARAYLAQLVVSYETLEAEKQKLLAAPTRLAEIATEKADLIADAQSALDKYNTLEGTNYTLAQARTWFKRPIDPPGEVIP